MYSLTVKQDKIGTRNFASLYVGVLIADRIGRNLGMLLVTVFCTFGRPYKIPGLDPIGEIFSSSSLEILFYFFKFLK